MLIGHDAARAAFLEAWTSGRTHHAWLLAGPEGVGKRTFADRAALTVLAGAATLGVEDDHPAARLVAAGSHPDLKLIARERLDDGRLRKEIVVEQIRALAPVLQMTPGLGGWRVVVVDPVDALNPAASNALLKNLEEPPRRTLFLLVSHAPGRLLPTIRSRCRALRFGPLDDADTRAVLVAGGVAEVELAALADLAEGAPGRALRWAGLGVAGLQAELDALPGATPAEARGRAAALARSLSGKATQARYEAFLELAPRTLARLATTRAGARLAATLALWEEARDLAADAVPLALDPAMVTAELARAVAAAGPEPV